MNPDPSKLRQQQQQESEQSIQGNLKSGGAQQFGTAEELIRFDAAATPAPEIIAERLKETMASEPPPPRSWWQRLISRFS